MKGHLLIVSVVIVLVLLGIGIVSGEISLPFLSNIPSSGRTGILETGQGAPVGVAVDQKGTVYWTDYDSGELLSLPMGAAAPKVLLAGLNHPSGVAVDSSGNLFYAESFSQNVSELPAGSSTPRFLFNAGGYATFLALDSKGNVYVVEGPDTCNGQGGAASTNSASSIVEFDVTTRAITTVVSDAGRIGGVFVTSSGNLYYTTCSGTVKEIQDRLITPETIVSGLSPSTGVAVDANGDIFYTEYSSGVYVLRAGSSSSTIVIGGNQTQFYGLALDGNGDVFYTANLAGTVSKVSAGV